MLRLDFSVDRPPDVDAFVKQSENAARADLARGAIASPTRHGAACRRCLPCPFAASAAASAISAAATSSSGTIADA